jgi:hypothetical protein
MDSVWKAAKESGGGRQVGVGNGFQLALEIWQEPQGTIPILALRAGGAAKRRETIENLEVATERGGVP